MTPTDVMARIDRLFAERGGSEYHGEAVTQLEHALQGAHFAEQEGQLAEIVAAALLHDIGHMLHGHGEDYLDKNINDRHEELGARFLAHAFGPAVTEPIRLHVPAKRYLASGKHPAYPGILSPASVKSLELQGGQMSPAEIVAFEAEPHFAAAAKVREYDDRAKVVGMETPPYSHFRKYLEASLRG
ncbi:HD domain-containing protein [Gemmata sp. JC717]|uniref:HD domain-containing protein n=1 Tax=Gemmata algarum TaxID=2975278 RepID=UPI0021BB2DBC|nr:HD domain-containing protein [Gemmata algarum]MDY3553526.1 HD domain-containing protein [Gemmata algarum]